MRRINAGSVSLGFALAVFGGGATVAGLTDLELFGDVLMIVGGIIALVSAIILWLGVLGYMQERKETRDANFLLNQRRSERESIQHDIDMRRLKLELDETQSQEETRIYHRLTELKQVIGSDAQVAEASSGAKDVPSEQTSREKQVAEKFNKMSAEGSLGEHLTPELLYQTLARIWETTGKSTTEEREQAFSSERASHLDAAISATSEMKEQTLEEASSASPAAFLASQIDAVRDREGNLPKGSIALLAAAQLSQEMESAVRKAADIELLSRVGNLLEFGEIKPG